MKNLRNQYKLILQSDLFTQELFCCVTCVHELEVVFLFDT